MTIASATPSDIARVLIPAPLSDAYDYLWPEGDRPETGSFVEVPFGGRKMVGVLWGSGQSALPQGKLKTVNRILPIPPVPEISRAFIDWVSAYTLAPRGAVLKMLFGNAKLVEPKKNDAFDCPLFDPDFFQPVLNEEQQKAAAALRYAFGKKENNRLLLDGVTGSGKTEVFCEAIAECLRQGKQTLVMLPEIAMTAALIDRFAARFGERPIEWHSGLGERQRRLHWQAIARGEAKFILGARSALFLPYPDLGLIVVDEEHEGGYKQEDGVIYHARDMAVARAHLGALPVILSSATPSLETLFNAQQGKYRHVVLQKRFGKAKMPHVACVDLRQSNLPSHEFISPPLFDALKETLAAGQQSMLFLNRRGYAPLTLCRKCGHRLQCPRCTAWLTAHKKSGRLHCHHCDYSIGEPKKCPSCGAESSLAACGPGVERIAEEVHKRLPEARVAIMASDTLDDPKEAQALVGRVEKREIDILVGTQIMAKGYHFPYLTLVGVVDGDLGLAGGDPRASERTFQLLQQVAGRSGRSENEGRVLLQTTSPAHPVMKAIIKGDRDAFMKAELKEREAYRLPPYWRLASVMVSGADRNAVIKAAQLVASSAPENGSLRILGPAPAPFAMLRGKHRYRLMVQAPKTVNLSASMRGWLAAIRLPRHLRVSVDIDPYSFL